MFEVKVTVEIPGLPEAINNLASALSKGQPHTVCNQLGAECQHIDNAGVVNFGGESKGVTASATPDPVVNPTTAGASFANAPTPAVTPNAPANVAAPSPDAEAKNVTMDDLGRAGAALIDAGKMPQLIALLGKFGVQAVTQLKPEQFNAFADEMKALGAKF